MRTNNNDLKGTILTRNILKRTQNKKIDKEIKRNRLLGWKHCPKLDIQFNRSGFREMINDIIAQASGQTAVR